MLRSLPAAAAACLVLLAACGGDSSGGSGTERPPLPVIADGVPASGNLASAAEVDSFTVEALPSIATVRLHLEVPAGAAGSAVAQLVGDAGTVFGSVRADPGGALDRTFSGWFDIPAAGLRQVRVSSSGGGPAGAYRLMLRVRRDVPEVERQAIVPGDTLRDEGLELPGDVDVFHHPTAPGDRLLVFFRSRSGRPDERMRLEIMNAAVPEMLVPGDGAPLEAHSTGRFTMPPGGTGIVGLRVSGEHGWERGAYDLFVYRVNPAPEVAPVALQPGVRTPEEPLAPLGDVDEFTYQGTEGEMLNILPQLVSGGTAGVTVELSRAGAGTPLASRVVSTPTADPLAAPLGRVVLPETGLYTVRVVGADSGSVAAGTGSVRVEAFRVNTGPETADARLRPGDVVRTESLDRPGDIDRFTLEMTEDALVVVGLRRPAAGPDVRVVVNGSTSLQAGEAGGWVRYQRLPFGAGTTATLQVEAPRTSAAAGPYELAAFRIDPAPETAPSTLVPGVVVRESFEQPGDVDRFLVSAPQGARVGVFVRNLDPARTPSLTAIVIGRPMYAWSNADFRTNGSGSMEVGDPILVHVMPEGTGVHNDTGSFEILVRLVDPAPEHVPAAYVVGDTVRGESIDWTGEHDEFHFDATAGQRLRIADHSPLSRPGRLYVEDPVTGEILRTNRDNGQHGPLREFVVPRTGRYRIRVTTDNPETSDPDFQYVGPYEFAIVPVTAPRRR